MNRPLHPPLSSKKLCHKSVHGSTGSPRTGKETPKFNHLAVRPHPETGYPVEGRTADCDTVSPGEGNLHFPSSLEGEGIIG